MKKIKILLLVLVSVLTVNVYATSSRFEGVVSANSKIIDNQMQIILSFKGEEVNDIKLKISYENKYLKYEGASFMEGYFINSEELVNDTKWNTVDLNVISNDFSSGASFAVLTFDILKPLKNYTSIFFYDYEAKGTEKYTYVDNGNLLKVKEENNEILSIVKKIDKNVKFEYWFYEHESTIFMGIGVFVILIVIVLFMPGNKKDNRASRVKKQISRDEPFKLDK